MKNLITILMITSTFVLAQIPQTVSFQGYLSDANGEQISDGNYEVTFRLFDALTDGNSVWEETHSMEISGSLISANLGSFTPIILPETGIPYLEIQIGDEILTPRQEITSSFFAFKSSESDTAGFAKTIPLYFTLQLDSLSTVTDSLFNLVLEEPDTAFIITYDTTFVFDSTFIFTYDTLTIFDTLNIVTYDTTIIFDSTFVFSFDTTIVYDTLNIFTYDTTVVYDTTYISVDGSALDFDFPDGIVNVTPVLIPGANTYTVPSGKNLYISNLYSSGGIYFTVNGVQFNGYGTTPYNSLFILGENMVIATTGNPININGYLVDKKKDFIVIDLSASNYIVPSGKILVITNYSGTSIDVSIDGVYFYSATIGYSGQVLSGDFKFIGYLTNQ